MARAKPQSKGLNISSPHCAGVGNSWQVFAFGGALSAILILGLSLYLAKERENAELRQLLAEARSKALPAILPPSQTSSPTQQQASPTDAGTEKLLADVAALYEQSPFSSLEKLYEELSLRADKCAPLFEISCMMGLSGFGAAVMIRMFDTLGNAHAVAKQFEKALWAHENALELKRIGRWSVAELALSYSQLASDAKNLFQLDRALVWIRKAQELSTLPHAAMAVLFRQEASIHECGDDYVSALHRFEHSLALAKQGGAQESPEDMSMHLDLLKHVLYDQKKRGMPASVATAMHSKMKQMTEQLIEQGRGMLESQLPKHYVPGLTTRPWHKIEPCYNHTGIVVCPGWYTGVADRHGKSASHSEKPSGAISWMERAQVLTRDAQFALIAEYQELKAVGKLQQETECIHSHQHGHWSRFELNAVWEKRESKSGVSCSVDTPVACDLFRRLQSNGMPLIRAGYSSISAGTRLKPHFGRTNAQLKWHLGLQVPSTPKQNCARIRVANKTRSWQQGEILFFDDSFEHEVRNNCDSERVVFQLVFAHPDLGGGANAIKCATGERACPLHQHKEAAGRLST